MSETSKVRGHYGSTEPGRPAWGAVCGSDVPIVERLGRWGTTAHTHASTMVMCADALTEIETLRDVVATLWNRMDQRSCFDFVTRHPVMGRLADDLWDKLITETDALS